MGTNALKWLRALIIPVAFIIAAIFILPSKCGSSRQPVQDPAMRRLTEQNDSLRKSNSVLQVEKQKLKTAIVAVTVEITRLKASATQSTYKYNNTRDKGLVQVVTHPCDSAANVAAFVALDKACVEVVSKKDSVIGAQDSKIAKQDSVSAVQEEQITNLNTVDANAQANAQALEQKLVNEQLATKRQRLKTWAVGIVGAAATALVTYFAIINK